VDEVNRSLAGEPRMGGAQIRRFLILHKELDADDGELTRTQKVRRGFIAERYAPLVTALYDGSEAADISTEVTFEDGRKGVIAARVKVRDAKLYPTGQEAPSSAKAA
jgi:long-chain acyl-CoA synthetase